MQIITKQKDPNANVDFTVNWAAWLASPSSDTIASVTWTVADGITQTASSFTATTAVIWLSGGTLGGVYQITCRITTLAGRIEDYTFKILIENN